jgi:hypothetical protein
MSDESPRESVDESTDEAATVEFEAIEADPDSERIEFELMLAPDKGEGPVSVEIKPDFKHRIELRFGRTSETSPCLLVPGSECPQLGAEYVLIQPDVIAKDPRKGWVPLGGIHAVTPTALDTAYVGREESPQLRLGPDVSRHHAEVAFGPNPYNMLEVRTFQDEGPHYVRVSVHPDDLVELPPGMRVVR